MCAKQNLGLCDFSQPLDFGLVGIKVKSASFCLSGGLILPLSLAHQRVE